MAERKAFNFYKSYYDIFKQLDKDKDKLLFIEALLDRQFTGSEPKLTGMANFAYVSQKHSIDSQVLGFETKTGTRLAPCQGGIKGASVQEKGKEEGKGEVQPVFCFKKSLIDLGIEEKIILEWLSVRSKKKASNTETALEAIKIQIDKSGLSANECIKKSVENSWAGFKAAWIDNIKPPTKQTNITVSDYSKFNPEVDNKF